jgi:hypothetical protein
MMLSLLAALLVVACASASKSAECAPTSIHKIIIAAELFSPVNGLAERLVLAINGTVPAPEIRVPFGACVRVLTS